MVRSSCISTISKIDFAAARLPDPDGAGPLGQQVTGRVSITWTEHCAWRASGTHRTRRVCWPPPTAMINSDGPRGVVQSDPDGCGPLLAPETTYHYDVMGNQTVESERLDQDRMLVRTTLYDNLNRPWKTIETCVGSCGPRRAQRL